MDISTATTFASGLVGLIVPAFVQAFKKYIPSGYVGLVSLAASILFGTIAIAATGGFDGTCTWGVVLAGVVGVSQTVYTLVKAFDGKLSKPLDFLDERVAGGMRAIRQPFHLICQIPPSDLYTSSKRELP